MPIVLVDLTARALDPGEARDIAKHFGRAPWRGPLDVLAVSVVTATLASRFIRGVWVPVTTRVWSCSGSLLKGEVLGWPADPAATVTLAESGRNPSIRARTSLGANGYSREHIRAGRAGLCPHRRPPDRQLSSGDGCALLVNDLSSNRTGLRRALPDRGGEGDQKQWYDGKGTNTIQNVHNGILQLLRGPQAHAGAAEWSWVAGVRFEGNGRQDGRYSRERRERLLGAGAVVPQLPEDPVAEASHQLAGGRGPKADRLVDDVNAIYRLCSGPASRSKRLQKRRESPGTSAFTHTRHSPVTQGRASLDTVRPGGRRRGRLRHRGRHEPG